MSGGIDPDHIYYDNTKYCLLHLKPFTFHVDVGGSVSRRVDVAFKDHCFTRSFLDEAQIEKERLKESKKKNPDLNKQWVLDDPAHRIFGNRIFCTERYELSHQLKDIVQGLPRSKVYQTWTERNFVYVAQIDTPSGPPYHVFFKGERIEHSKKVKYVLMEVESAYPMEESLYVPPFDKVEKPSPSAIRFTTFVDNIFMKRPIVINRL